MNLATIVMVSVPIIDEDDSHVDLSIASFQGFGKHIGSVDDRTPGVRSNVRIEPSHDETVDNAGEECTDFELGLTVQTDCVC